MILTYFNTFYCVGLEYIPHSEGQSAGWQATGQRPKEMIAETDNRFFLVIFAFQKHFQYYNEHIHEIRPDIDRR